MFDAVFYIAKVNTIDDLKISHIFYYNQILSKQVIGGKFYY